MRLNLLVGLFLLYCSVGSACGSYEECMDRANDASTYSNTMAIKAIAFKLDEIEKIIREKR